MNDEAMTMMVVLPTVFGSIAWCFRLFLNFLQQRRLWKHLFALQDKVLDKYGSSPEALQYLESDAGKQMLESAALKGAEPRAKVLGAIQTGTVLSALSVGFLLVRPVVSEGVEGFTIIGTLGLCLGLGFLISAAVSYHLSKSWGVFDATE